MGVSEDLDKAIELLNGQQPPESYILVCSPEMAAMIEQFGGLPEHVTLQKSPYCDLDKAYLVKDEKRRADRGVWNGSDNTVRNMVSCRIHYIHEKHE